MNRRPSGYEDYALQIYLLNVLFLAVSCWYSLILFYDLSLKNCFASFFFSLIFSLIRNNSFSRSSSVKLSSSSKISFLCFLLNNSSFAILIALAFGPAKKTPININPIRIINNIPHIPKHVSIFCISCIFSLIFLNCILKKLL